MRHPCGNLPLTTFSVQIHFCHHHMAWFADVNILQQDDDEPQVVGRTHIDFGPFDRMDDVVSWLTVALGSAQRLPGGPWVP